MARGGKGGSLITGTNDSGLTARECSLESAGFRFSTGAPRFPKRVEGAQWFAVRVKSNFESTAALHFRERGYHEFLPTYTVRSRWSDRIKTIERALFPGYVFCNFSPHRRLPILTTPGVLHIVGFGKEPIPVEANELEAVWTTLHSGVLLRPWPFLQVGKRVCVERGPLTGIEGVVTQFKGSYRLVVSVSLLQRSIAAEVEREWIRPIA